jgi:hypothetical protein
MLVTGCSCTALVTGGWSDTGLGLRLGLVLELVDMGLYWPQLLLPELLLDPELALQLPAEDPADPGPDHVWPEVVLLALLQVSPDPGVQYPLTLPSLQQPGYSGGW